MPANDNLSAFILHKLYKLGYWGGRHTSIENLKKSPPGHIRGEVKDAVKELIREGLLLPKPTHYGMGVSLNPNLAEHIKKIIQDYTSKIK